MSNDHTTRFVVKGASTHRARLFHARALAIVFSLSRCFSLYLSLSLYIHICIYKYKSLFIYNYLYISIYIHRCMYACVSNVRMIQGFSKINAHRITTYVYTHAHGSSNMFQECRTRSAIMLTMFHCLSDLPEGGLRMCIRVPTVPYLHARWPTRRNWLGRFACPT